MKKVVLFFSVFLIAFSACKKYDESNLWFKNPEKIAFISGRMTHYIVNGIDSIDYLDNYFYNDFYNNNYTYDFSDLEFHTTHAEKGYYEFNVEKPSNYIYPYNIIDNVEYEYSNKGKSLKLYRTKTILNSYGKNIFINDAIVWQITYLKRKDKTRKMKGTYNGNTYEIQFN